MLSFFSKQDFSDAFAFLHTDMHSHLLPGVDDGSPDVETSVDLLKNLQDVGFKKVITTPHIYQPFHKNTKAGLESVYNSLQPQLKDKGIHLDFEVASEYFVDEHFEGLIRKDEIMSFGDKYVLIEISFVAFPKNLDAIIFELTSRGYKPVLAHPERYLYLADNVKFFENLIRVGCILQPNINSFMGYYGRKSEEVARFFVEEKMASLLGTDMHHYRHLDGLKTLMKNKKIMKLLQNHTWLNASL